MFVFWHRWFSSHDGLVRPILVSRSIHKHDHNIGNIFKIEYLHIYRKGTNAISMLMGISKRASILTRARHLSPLSSVKYHIYNRTHGLAYGITTALHCIEDEIWELMVGCNREVTIYIEYNGIVITYHKQKTRTMRFDRLVISLIV